MKKIIILLTFFFFSTQVFSQVRMGQMGDAVFYKNQHIFTVVATDYSGFTSEYIITNTQGVPLLAFVPFKIQDGWKSESYKSDYSSQSKSGTSYTYFFRVASLSGESCDIPARAISGSRGISKLIIGFGLIKSDALDETVFAQFCAMHGKVYDNLKYFK
jgi:hypothetical protein